MRGLLLAIGLCAAIPLLTDAQSPPRSSSPGPAFAVASVKRNTTGARRTRVGADGVRPQLVRFVATNAPLRALLLYAYPKLLNYSLIGGPGWMDTDRFDVEGKPDEPASSDQLKLMLRTLLEERFALKAHLDTRELPVYRLVVGSRLRIARSPDQSPPGTFSPPAPGQPMPRGGAQISAEDRGAIIEGHAVPISDLVSMLQIDLSRRLIDGTNLSGLFDLTLRFTPERSDVALSPAADAAFPSVFSAIQDQLGLRLESDRGPVEVLVIDSVQRPIDN